MNTHTLAFTSSVALLLSSSVLAQGEPAIPAKPATTIPAIPMMRPATKSATNSGTTAAKPADSIDAKAKEILDGAVQSAIKLKAIEFVTEISDGGGKFFAIGDFGDKPGGLPARVRLSRLEDGKPVLSVIADGQSSIAIDFKAKTYTPGGAEWMTLGADVFGGFPRWIVEQRMSAGHAMDEMFPKLVAISLGGTTKLDGAECDIVKATRELSILAGEDETEPAKKRVIRFTEELAIARTDHLPRRIVSSVGANGGEGEADGDTAMESASETVLLTVVNAQPKLAADQFDTKAPSGFTKVDPPSAGESGGEAQLTLNVKPGDAAHEFALKDLDGKEVTLASLKGKVVLLDFWATWCGPCKAAMPTIQKISEEYKGKAVAVFGVNTWEKKEGAAKKYIESKKYTYPCLLSGDDLAKGYAVPGIPTLIIIGKDGKIVLAEVGLEDESGNNLRKAIDEALSK